MTAQPCDPPDYTTPDPGDPTALEADFAELHHAIGRLSEDTPARLDQDDTADAACLLLWDLREARKRLAEIEAFVEAHTARRLSRRRTEVAGFVAEVKGGNDRKAWQHDKLAWDVCRPLAVDATGTVDDAAAVLIGLVRDRFLNCASIAYWRAGQLRQLGLDPDDYADVTRGRRTVALTPAVES